MFIDADIYSRFRPTVACVASSYARNPEDQQDLEQEAWLVLLKTRQPEDLQKAWVSTVAQHQCQNLRGRELVRNRGRFYADPNIDTDESLGFEDLGDSTTQVEHPAIADIRDAVDHLPDDQRELIIRRFNRGESTVEIVAEAKLAPRSIDQRIHKILTQIRSSIPASETITPVPDRSKVDRRPYTRLMSDNAYESAAGDANKTTVLERLYSGRVVYAHQHLDEIDEQAAAEILAEERQEFYAYPLSTPRPAVTSKIQVRIDHLQEVVELVRINPNTQPSVIRDQFGYGPEYARKVLCKARKLAGVRAKHDRRSARSKAATV